MAVLLLIARVSIPAYVSLLLMLPMGIDGTVQYLFRKESTNLRRLITGVLFGLGFIMLLALVVLWIAQVLF